MSSTHGAIAPKEAVMNFKEQLNGVFEPLFLAMLLAWTVGTTVALLIPEGSRERQGVVEIYSLTDANTGV
jgi:hypothetical protein